MPRSMKLQSPHVGFAAIRGEHKSETRVRRSRGVTLIEVLITLAIVAVITGLATFGMGVTSSARLKTSSITVASALQLASVHATAISRPVRLVFDIDAGKITMEASESAIFLKRQEKAESSAEYLTKKAEAAGNQYASGAKDETSDFKPTKAFRFPETGVELERGIRFRQIQTDHAPDAVTEGKAYLYFFPTGQTETAAIQLRTSNADEAEESNFVTITVAPLTAKASIAKGRLSKPEPRTEAELSDREDPG